MSQPRTTRKPPLPPEASRPAPSAMTNRRTRAPEAATGDPSDSAEITLDAKGSSTPAPAKSLSAAQSSRPSHRVARSNPLDASTKDEKTKESAPAVTGHAPSTSAGKSTTRMVSKITRTTTDSRRLTGTIATGAKKQPAVIREGQGNRSSPQAKPGKPIKSVVNRAADNSIAASSSTNPGKKQETSPRTTTSVRVNPPSRYGAPGRLSKQSEPIKSPGPQSGSRAVRSNIGSTGIPSRTTSRPPSAIPSRTTSRTSSAMNIKAAPGKKQIPTTSTESPQARPWIVPDGTHAREKQLKPTYPDTARKSHRPSLSSTPAARGKSSFQIPLRQAVSTLESHLPQQPRGREPTIAFTLGDRSRITTATGDVGCGNIVIVGDERESRKKRIHEALQNRLASQDVDRVLVEKDLCYPGTRVDIIRRILEWAQTPTREISLEEQPGIRHQCLCITGVPGSGKSTLSATLAQELKDEHVLFAHFIISRSAQMSAQPNNVFPTIADQLARRSDDAAKVIETSIDKKPSVVDVLNNDQGKMLFLEPLRTISRNSHMAIVIIDALDELEPHGRSSSFISILANLVSSLPLNVKIILSSRPENDIVEVLRCRVESLELDTTKSVDDVRSYLQGKLLEIVPKDEHWSNWPSQEQVDDLSAQASGLFMWAATALKYLASQVKAKGRACRDTVLSQLRSKGLLGLDGLYKFILQSVILDDDDSEEESIRFRHTVGCLIVLAEPLPIVTIGDLLRISVGCFDLLRFFERLRSVLISGSGKINKHTVPYMHKSFVEYLTGGRADPQLHIDEHVHHFNIVSSAFHAMHALHFNMFLLESSYVRNSKVTNLDERIRRIPRELLYSCDYWIYHMEMGQEFDEHMLNEVRSFMEDRLLAWFEVLAMRTKPDIIASAMIKLSQWIKGRDDMLETFVQDAGKFTAVYLPVMSESIPHIYLSALPLSPSSSLVANHYIGHHAKTVTAFNKAVGWNPEVLSIRASSDRSSDRVWDNYRWWIIVISPDDRYIASCHSSTITLWSMATGAEIRRFSGSAQITLLAFSPDDRQVISCSCGNIAVRNLQTGEVIGAIRTLRYADVLCMSQSPDGKILLTASTDSKIRFWDMETFQAYSDPIELRGGGLPKDILSRCVFSPFEYQRPASVSNDNHHGSVTIWDVGTGEVVVGPLSPSTDNLWQYYGTYPESITFSPDGTRFAVLCAHIYDKPPDAITICNAKTGVIIAGPFCGHGHESSISCIAFSPDGTRIVSGYTDTSVIVWDSYTGNIIAGPFDGREPVKSVVFSHNSKLVASYSTSFIWVWSVGNIDTAIDDDCQTSLDVFDEMGFSSDGQSLLFAHSQPGIDHHGGTVITRFDLDSCKATRHSNMSCAVEIIRFSPDGTHLAWMGGRSCIHLWNMNTGTSLTLKLPPLPISYRPLDLVFSPNGRTLANIWHTNDDDSDCHLILFNPITGNTIGYSVLRNFSIDESVGLTFNGRIVLQANARSPRLQAFLVDPKTETYVRLRDSTTGREFSKLCLNKTSHSSIVCSPTQYWFASWKMFENETYHNRNDRICIWDMEGNKASQFIGSEETTSLAYSPDGRRIVSAHHKGNVKIWDVTTKTLIGGPLYGHTFDMRNTVKFSPNGKHFATYEGSKARGNTRTLRIWDMESVINNAAKQKNGGTIEFRDDFKFGSGGWILGRNKEIILWIPPTYRQRLWFPSNTCVPGKNNLRLDWTNAVQGEEWVRCCEPLPPKIEK